ncbi:MAG TPA: hypothetical protein VI759_05585 [Dehalococcoidia bacterium]|nr:hypothetical protein [Dehalococcoidia bacterium]
MQTWLFLTIWRKTALTALGAAAVSALVLACGGGSDAPATSTQPAASATAAIQASGPGTITVSFAAIRNQSGRVLLVFATREGGGPQLARLCIPITSNSFATTGIVMTEMPSGGDPCGATTAATSFPEGRYTLTAGIYAPPSQSPDKQITQTVEVKGNASVSLNGDALSR